MVEKLFFVGTKKQAQEATKEEAIRSDSFYMTERWLGGTLTNFRTIRRRINRLDQIEKMEENGTFDLLPKKEVIKIKKEYDKLHTYFEGVRNMKRIPDAMIIVDPKKEANAIKEAHKLNIPVFGLVDTNCDPEVVDYVIPANDDAVRSIKVVLGVLNNAICEATNKEMVEYVNEEDKLKPAKEEKKETVKKEVKKETKKEEKVDYSKMTVAELKKIAKEKGIEGYSKLKKDELIKALN